MSHSTTGEAMTKLKKPIIPPMKYMEDLMPRERKKRDPLAKKLDVDAIVAAAKAIDPLPFQPVTGPGPRGYECSTPDRVNRFMALRQSNAIKTAQKAISAYIEAIAKLGGAK